MAERSPTAGGADEFLRFLSDELIPWVEGQYRTASFRVLVGHSLGGLSKEIGGSIQGLNILSTDST